MGEAMSNRKTDETVKWEEWATPAEFDTRVIRIEPPGGDIARIPPDSRVERIVKSAHSIPYRKYNRATGLRVPIPGDGG
jgi:hypothetical protein